MKKVRMIHIGKTGGTALKTMFKAKDQELSESGYHARGRGHDITLAGLAGKERSRIVVFVRHPVARFVSGFNSRLREGLPRYYTPWDPAERLAFSRFENPNDLAEALSSEDWKEWAKAKRSMSSIHHVKDHATKWLVSPEFLEANRDNLFYIGTTETMDEDVVKLFGKMGVTPPKKPNQKERHVTPVQYSRELSDKAVANLTQWYAADIEIYEWCLANRAAINGA